MFFQQFPKYLNTWGPMGTNINNSNCMRDKLCIKAGNGCYFATYVTNVQIKMIISEDQKKITYYVSHDQQRPVHVEPGPCATTAGVENRLNTFERKVLRKMYGPIYIP